ncbi:hypothetical protein [Stenotrophomonas sp.]|uniref:hypothetical protein n=1 Tax=Stenotrophomonas sp. TaxID=69392 RepID=UPI00289EA88D|nr:hypothetical protein [Stenotrophomonas sp.]
MIKMSHPAAVVAMLAAMITAGCVADDPPVQAEAAVAVPDPAHTVERPQGTAFQPAQPLDPAEGQPSALAGVAVQRSADGQAMQIRQLDEAEAAAAGDDARPARPVDPAP